MDRTASRLRFPETQPSKQPAGQGLQPMLAGTGHKPDTLLNKEIAQGSRTRLAHLSEASQSEVINVSSDEEEAEVQLLIASPTKGSPSPRKTRQTTDEGPHKSTISTAKRTILSNQVVIDLTLDSSDSEPPSPRKKVSPRAKVRNDRVTLIGAPLPSVDNARFDSVNGSWEDPDGGVITFNEPRSARKPIPRKRVAGRDKPPSSDTFPATPKKKSAATRKPLAPQFQNGDSDSEGHTYPESVQSSKVSNSLGSPCDSKKKKAPRLTKKAILAAEQGRREAYAQELFNELNESVFNGGIPPETTLKWSNRLLTTAGRARWHKSKDGVQTTEIELATKVLDCNERIRNTLSHEMCHLACWIIDCEVNEAHGRIFKSWATKVMRRRPDIEVTTKHSYEISYPYEWECENCAKVYGRFSKSIRPDECLCGACRTGTLKPLFSVRTPSTPRSQVNASSTVGERHDPPRVPSTLREETIDDGNVPPTPKEKIVPASFSSPKLSDNSFESELDRLLEELGGFSVSEPSKL